VRRSLSCLRKRLESENVAGYRLPVSLLFIY
jgi:hypothetical protein